MEKSGIKAVYITAGSSAVIFDNSLGGVPQVCYWGESLGELAASDVSAATLANREPLGGNPPDLRSPTRIVPLESDGWLGRPGLVGSRVDGTAWTPRVGDVVVELPDSSKLENSVAFVKDDQVKFT